MRTRGIAALLVSAALGVTTSACSQGPSAPAAARPAAPTASPLAGPSPSPTPAIVGPLTLESLFHPPSAVPDDPFHYRTLLATGDVIPARMVNVEATRRGDFIWPFRPTAPLLRSADIAWVNLETPLFAGCPLAQTGFTFCGDGRFVQGLSFAGVDAANLGNEHIHNYGQQGVDATIRLLDSHGIAYSGLGHTAFLNVRGFTFALLGFNDVEETLDRAEMKREIASARTRADVVVVQFHWGKEYERQPMAAPGVAADDPVTLGHLAVDDGADLVIGNHQHWYEGVEIYHGRLITYAHGNFVFDQSWSEQTEEGVVGIYSFYGDRLVAARWVPVHVDGLDGQPSVMPPGPAAKVLSTMEAASKQLAARLGEPT
ncbi:MAG: CapA family protein [Candidatus Dormibacterales bacterium]